MGLRTTHGCWSGSYSSFNIFRTILAELVGINLREMSGFEGEISWDPYKHLDLYPLLDHEDCDGILTVEECKRVARGLRNIVQMNDPDSQDHRKIVQAANQRDWSITSLLEAINQFATGCEAAVEAGEEVKFH